MSQYFSLTVVSPEKSESKKGCQVSGHTFRLCFEPASCQDRKGFAPRKSCPLLWIPLPASCRPPCLSRELSGSFGLLLSAGPKETSLAGAIGAGAITGQCRCAGGRWAWGRGADRPIKAARDIAPLLHPPPRPIGTLELAELHEFS